MATEEKSEEDLLALDDTDEIESKNGNEELGSKEEDDLLSKEDIDESDVECIAEIVEKDTSVPNTLSLSNAAELVLDTSSAQGVTLMNEENYHKTACSAVQKQPSTVLSSLVVNNNGEAQENPDSDEDIVEIAVIKNSVSQQAQVQNSFAIGSSNVQAERLRRAREEERNRLLQREKVSEFNFRSNRLQQQRKRVRYNTDGRPMIYADDFDFCDCLQPNCPGCHYPCKSCGDCRCGHECRVNRRYVYESIELEGRNITLKTPKTTKSTT